MMLPGKATLRVVDRGPEGVKTAVGLEVSTSLEFRCWVPFVWASVRFRFY
jgi:hypothetical protein